MEGVRLMFVGMGAVFSLLTLLVIMLHVSARLFERFDRPDTSTDELDRIAVVLAAIDKHRNNRA